MQNQDSTESTNSVETVAALLNQLRVSFSWKENAPWRALVCALLYGIIAMLQGTSFALLYLGTLVVIFLVQSHSEQRNRKQIDLLIEIIEEMEIEKTERQDA